MAKIVEKRIDGSVRVYTDPTGRKLKTEQHWKEEADVNNIIQKFQRTGQLPTTRGPGQYADLSVVPGSLSEAMEQIAQANSLFESLPSHVRREFKNDPKEMVKFIEDPKNTEECIKLGLKQTRPLSDKEKAAHKQKQPKESKNESKSKSDSSADA